MVFEEIADFLAAEMPAEKLIGFQPSQAARDRVEYLLGANARGEISPAERAELSQYIQIEELLGLMKARAYAKLENSSHSLASP